MKRNYEARQDWQKRKEQGRTRYPTARNHKTIRRNCFKENLTGTADIDALSLSLSLSLTHTHTHTHVNLFYISRRISSLIY